MIIRADDIVQGKPSLVQDPEFQSVVRKVIRVSVELIKEDGTTEKQEVHSGQCFAGVVMDTLTNQFSLQTIVAGEFNMSTTQALMIGLQDLQKVLIDQALTNMGI